MKIVISAQQQKIIERAARIMGFDPAAAGQLAWDEEVMRFEDILKKMDEENAGAEQAKFVACYVFKPTHTERHYLVNPNARTYAGAISRDKDKAMLFSSADAAMKAIEKKLELWDRGRAGGYFYTSIVEPANA